MMKPSLIDFYNNWSKKAQGIDTATLGGMYDKYITLFVIYNNLYNQVPPKLAAGGFPLPKKIYDNKAATEYVVNFLGAKAILEAYSHNKNEGDIEAIIEVIRNEEFYIKIKNGLRQRNEDLLLLADLESKNNVTKATAVLQVIYHVRCNLFHGEKDFQEYQRKLVQPLINLLSTLISTLYKSL